MIKDEPLSLLKIFSVIYKYISRLEEFFVGAGLLAITVVVFINVLTRYLLNYSFSWAEELTRYLMVAVAFIGAAICSRRGIHLGIDFFFSMLPDKIRKIVAILISGVGAAFTFVLTLLSIQLIENLVETGQRSAAMNVPMTFVYASIPIGCGLMALHFIIGAFFHLAEREVALKASEKED